MGKTGEELSRRDKEFDSGVLPFIIGPVAWGILLFLFPQIAAFLAARLMK